MSEDVIAIWSGFQFQKSWERVMFAEAISHLKIKKKTLPFLTTIGPLMRIISISSHARKIAKVKGFEADMQD